MSKSSLPHASYWVISPKSPRCRFVPLIRRSGAPLREHAGDVEVEVPDQLDPSIGLVRCAASGQVLFKKPAKPPKGMVRVDNSVRLQIIAPLFQMPEG